MRAAEWNRGEPAEYRFKALGVDYTNKGVVADVRPDSISVEWTTGVGGKSVFHNPLPTNLTRPVRVRTD